MTWFFASILAFFAVQVADVVTTIIALRKGGREANPLLAWAMDKLGYGWVALKLGVGLWAGWLIVSGPTPELLWLVVGVTGYVAYRNFRIIK